MLIGEETNILLELLVDTLSLAIGLWVIDCQSCDFDPKDAIQFTREIGDELRSVI